MEKAWKELVRLDDSDAEFIKDGRRLASIEPEEILKRAAGELVELAHKPTDPFEAADLFSCLIHYCIVQGWSMEQLEESILVKLQQRIAPARPVERIWLGRLPQRSSWYLYRERGAEITPIARFSGVEQASAFAGERVEQGMRYRIRAGVSR